MAVLVFLSAGLVNRLDASEDHVEGQTFYLSFNRRSAIADFAPGGASPLDFTANLEFRVHGGPDGTMAFVIQPDETLRYRADQHIDFRQGTVVMWVQAVDYDPGLINKSDGNLSHKPYFTGVFKRGKEWVKLHLYQYYDDNTVKFYWSSSWDKPKDYRLASGSLADVRRGRWFQIAATWDADHLRIYRDGKYQSEANIPPELKDILARFVPDPQESTIGIREPYWGRDSADGQTRTAVDEIRVFNRPLSELEITRLYRQIAGEDAGSQPLPDFDVQLDGVDDGGPLDRLLMSLDYRALDPAWHQAISAGQVTGAVQIAGPAESPRTETWKPSQLEEQRMLDRIVSPGEYGIEVTLSDGEGRQVRWDRAVVRPETSWADSRLGLEDTVPSPWTAMQVDELAGRVGVWGRIYSFANDAGEIGPFPSQVTHEGRELLEQGPQLVVVTDRGVEQMVHRVTGWDASHASYVTIQGVGQADSFTIDWTTRVDFDGLVRCDFRIAGRPQVQQMYLTWHVKREFSDYVLDPLLKVSGNGTYASLFPYNERKSATVLWLTNEQRGFCWMPEHDANWIYDPNRDKPIQVTVDDAGGHCRIDLVNRPVVMPEGADYHAMFMATPSRPLMDRFRTLTMGGYGRYDQCEYTLDLHEGQGQDGIYSLKPTEHFPLAMEKTYGSRYVLPYAAASALNDLCDTGRYFRRYWDLPGGGSGPMRDRLTNTDYMVYPASPHTRYADYLINNLQLLYEHPASRNVGGIYFDLVNNTRCDNPLNGSRLIDDFGRQTSILTFSGMRQLMLRALRVSRRHGYLTMLHSHSYYNPAIHGFGDLWYPGEQYATEIQGTRNPYYYSDHIPDDVFRTELNMALKGSAIRFLGQLQRADKTLGGAEQTRAMCTRLLLHDIPVAIAYEDGPTINQIWRIQKDHDLDSARVTYFHDPGNVVRIDNPQVKATYYHCSNGRVLMVLGNLAKTDQQATVDLGPLLKGDSTVRDLWEGKPLALQDHRRITLTLPSRQFTFVGIDHAASAEAASSDPAVTVSR